MGEMQVPIPIPLQRTSTHSSRDQALGSGHTGPLGVFLDCLSKKIAGAKHTDGLKGSDPVSFERSRKLNYRDFPGSLVVKINAGGMGLLPDQGTKIPHAAQHSQTKNTNTKELNYITNKPPPSCSLNWQKEGKKMVPKWYKNFYQNLVENSHFDRCQQMLELWG